MNSSVLKIFAVTAGAALLAGSGFAQTTSVVIPQVADDFTDGNNTAGSRTFDDVSFRTQLIINADAISPNSATVDVVWFRQDTSNSNSTIHWGGGYYPNLKIEMSETTLIPDLMTNDFANNRVGATNTVLVYDAPFQLPELNGWEGDVTEWIPIALQIPYAFATAGNNLLIEFIADNPLGTPFTNEQRFSPDGSQPGGKRTFYGETGPNLDGLNVNVGGTTGNGTWGGLSVNGGINFRASAGSAGLAGTHLIGLSDDANGAGGPLDLSIIGAPGNSLYVGLITADVPFVTAFPPIGFDAVADLGFAIPNDPLLAYQSLYYQAIFVIPTANPLGVVGTRAIQVKLGDDPFYLPHRELHDEDPTAATGFLRFSSYNGGMNVRLTGQFN